MPYVAAGVYPVVIELDHQSFVPVACLTFEWFSVRITSTLANEVSIKGSVSIFVYPHVSIRTCQHWIDHAIIAVNIEANATLSIVALKVFILHSTLQGL